MITNTRSNELINDAEIKMANKIIGIIMTRGKSLSFVPDKLVTDRVIKYEDFCNIIQYIKDEFGN